MKHFLLRFPSDASAKQRNSFTSPRLGKVSSTSSDFSFLKALFAFNRSFTVASLVELFVWQTSYAISGLLWVLIQFNLPASDFRSRYCILCSGSVIATSSGFVIALISLSCFLLIVMYFAF